MHASKWTQQVELKMWLNGLQLLRVWLHKQKKKTCLRSSGGVSVCYETFYMQVCWSSSVWGKYVIRARAGIDLRGPYCFSNNHFFIPNDRIFHCLYISQSIVVLRGAVIKESVFWLITHIYFVTHWKTLYPPVHWIVLNLLDIGHAHFRPCFFFFFANSPDVANLLFCKRNPNENLKLCSSISTHLHHMRDVT